MRTQGSYCFKTTQSLQSIALTIICLVIMNFSVVRSSSGQAAEIATRSISSASESTISLAPAPKPSAAMVARYETDSKFENAPANYHIFPAGRAGEFNGVEVLTFNFAGNTTITGIKSTRKDFVIEPGGTCLKGTSYTRGDSCSLLVRFDPQGPGRRLGFLSIAHSASATAASYGLAGNGYAPVISFTPSLISTVPGTISSGVGTISAATSMAVDGGDILYIADTGNILVKEIDSTGTLTTTPLTPIATPASLAVDSFGIIYTANLHGSSTYYFSIYYPWGSQTAYGYTYTGSTCTVSAPCPFATAGMNYLANMSIDAYDDLFFEETTTGAAEMPVASIAGGSGSLNLWHLSDQFSYSSGSPASFAADASGNIYTYYNFSTSTCYLLEEPLYNAEYSPTANRVAGGVKCGFSGDGGLGRGAEISTSVGQIAFDIAGNLYFSDAGNQRVRRIDAATGIIRTIAGNGTAGNGGDNGPATKATLRSPAGLAVDSQGQVYVLSNTAATGTQQSIRKVGTTGDLVFPSTTQGVASATLLVNVANTGNSALSFVRDTLTGANHGDFSIDNNVTSCNFAAGNSLDGGQSCQIGVIFKPTAVGTRTATLNLLDNTVNGANKVNLSGAAVAATKVGFSAPASGQIAPTGFEVSVKVTSSYSTPTGNVNFEVDGKSAASATLVSGTASAVISPLTTGTHHLVAAYSGDKYHAASQASKTLTVQ